MASTILAYRYATEIVKVLTIHGTQALIAALDVHTGKVLAECRGRRTQHDLVAFMERVAVMYPGRQVHVVWDNVSYQANALTAPLGVYVSRRDGTARSPSARSPRAQ